MRKIINEVFRMINNNQIIEIVDKIVNDYYPDKIILFGSYAHGDFTENSDLDFIIVKDTSIPKHKRGLEVRRLFYRLPIPMDFKIYTNFEYANEIANQYSFLYSALKGSKVLYERKN
jgi:predicted nucleotidyltransferase